MLKKTIVAVILVLGPSARKAAADDLAVYSELTRLAEVGRCMEAAAKRDELRRTTAKPPVWLRLADARVLWCQERCAEARSLVESFLRDSEFVPKLRDARNGIVQSGGLRDEVQTCIARQHRALVWKVLGGIGGGLLAAGVTTALVLRFPPATSPLAGAAMSSPALHLTVRF